MKMTREIDIRRVTTQTGPGAPREFDQPSGVAVDTGAMSMWRTLATTGFRKVTPEGGDDVGWSERWFRCGGGRRGDVYVADTRNDTIRKVTPEGVVTTLAGLEAVRVWQWTPEATSMWRSATITRSAK
jgi:hypothetical protein